MYRQRILYPIRVSGSILGNWATNRWTKVPAHWGSGPRYCTWPILCRTTGTSFGLKLELLFSFKADESFVSSPAYSLRKPCSIRDQLRENLENFAREIFFYFSSFSSYTKLCVPLSFVLGDRERIDRFIIIRNDCFHEKEEEKSKGKIKGSVHLILVYNCDLYLPLPPEFLLLLLLAVILLAFLKFKLMQPPAF